MTIRPLHDRVLVRPTEAEKTRAVCAAYYLPGIRTLSLEKQDR